MTCPECEKRRKRCERALRVTERVVTVLWVGVFVLVVFMCGYSFHKEDCDHAKQQAETYRILYESQQTLDRAKETLEGLR